MFQSYVERLGKLLREWNRQSGQCLCMDSNDSARDRRKGFGVYRLRERDKEMK